MNEALPTGNRQSETRNAGTLPYVYSPTGSNRLFQTGSTSRYHTATGNTQSIGSTSFAYDGFNRLATAQTAAETTTYTYNALGERIKKRNQNGLQTVFHYGHNGELLFERDQAGNTKEYVWLDQRPLARIDNGTSIYYYHVDHLGTPQMMTDQSGTTVWRADYEPFGKANVRATSTVENNLRFPGQYADRETGMHYNYYRSAYNPGTGRYEEVDPIGIAGGLNVYEYARSNPLTYTDPLGLAPPPICNGPDCMSPPYDPTPGGPRPSPQPRPDGKPPSEPGSPARYDICQDFDLLKKPCKTCVDIACKYAPQHCCDVDFRDCFANAIDNPEKLPECVAKRAACGFRGR